MVATATLVDSDQVVVAASREVMTNLALTREMRTRHQTSIVEATLVDLDQAVAASQEDMVIMSSLGDTAPLMTSMQTPVDPSLVLLIRLWVSYQTFGEVAFADIIRFTGGLEKAAGKVTKNHGMAERGADRSVCQAMMTT